MFEPLKKQPAYLQVYNAIEAEILAERLPEGATLPTEAQLCDQFGVTRATVREGLRLLEQTRLVERGAAKRFYVKRPNADDVASAASKSLALSGATFHETWETLLAMYPPVTKLVTNKLQQQHWDELHRIHSELINAPSEDENTIVALAVDFFQCIANGFDNRVMLAMLQSLNMMIGASLTQVIKKTPKAKERITDAQEKILEALEKRDENSAAEWMEKHINDLKRGYTVAGVDLNQQVL